MRVAVIGGGASGLAAAITAAEGGSEVTVFERQERVGRKLMATGNGRCNLTNVGADEKNYHGAPARFVRPALDAYPPESNLGWFRDMGLVTVVDPEGRAYPFSDQAGSVLDVLRFRCGALGVRTLTGTEVGRIKRSKAGFAVNGESFERVIVACGGRAGEHLGGTGLGYELLRSLGHTVTPISPALVQLTVADDITKMLKGVRARAEVRLVRNGAVAAKRSGEVQFGENAVSGIVIFELSGAARPGDALSLDLVKPLTAQELEEALARRCAGMPELENENLLAGVLHSRLGRAVIKRCGVDFRGKTGNLSGDDLKRIALAAKSFSLTVTGRLGFREAQVTRGGAETGEFKPETLGSRLVPGLYACGEVLDVDGDCGGYNLQWAWSSGRLAGCLK